MNIRGRLLTGIRPITLIAALLAIILWQNAGMVMASDLSVQNVQVNQNTLKPGETVRLSFSLNKPAKVTVLVYTPDYNIVRHLITDQARPAGINNFTWNGHDDSGVMVPNEAYLFGITADGTDGFQAVYDPTAHSGGEIRDVRIQNIDNSQGKYKIAYTVPFPSRVNLRAGVHEGPMLKSLIDWQARPAGEYVYQWDGLDETGRIQVMEQSRTHLYIEAFALPENSVIVQESSSNYFEYRKGLPQQKEENVINYQAARRSTMQRISSGISAQSLVPRSLNVVPVFTVYLDTDRTTGMAQKPVTTVSGDTKLVIVVAPESMDAFNETRFEIIVFIDNLRFDEEEHAHTPYTYTLNTEKLSNGEHMVTINQACLTGQVGSYSFYINVNN